MTGAAEDDPYRPVPVRWRLCSACCQPVPTSTPRCAKCGALPRRTTPAERHNTIQDALRAALDAVREPARLAAAAIRAGQRDEAARGAADVILASGGGRHWHVHEWTNLPGLRKTVSFSTRRKDAKPPVTTFAHTLLPGWVYAEGEMWEMLQDLDALADGKGWPTQPTRGKPSPAGQGVLL